MKIKHLFISRTLQEDSPIKKWCVSTQMKLTAQSMIAIQFLKFAMPQSDYYFFSSRNGVRAFFADVNKKELAKAKFAVVGAGTNEELELQGYKADFIGQGNDTLQIGKDFESFLAHRTVTFCTNNLTLETVSRFVSKEQKQRLLVYQTELQPCIVSPKPDAYIFTSPSNFKAFIQKNELVADDVIIAIGKSTKQAILDNYPEFQVNTPENFSEEAIRQLLKDLSE